MLLIGTAPNVVATHPGRPFKTFADAIAVAKTKPESVTYGSIGNGSLGHLTMVMLSQLAGVKMVHVPYRGGGPLMNDALAGHVDLAIGSAALITPQVRGGKVRRLVRPARPASPDYRTSKLRSKANCPVSNPTLGGARSRPDEHLERSSIVSATLWRKRCANPP